jgi:ribose-phosphate pyrophosphokinase
MLQVVGVDRVMMMDLHADQIQGFFDIPVDNIYASPILLGDIWRCNYQDMVVVSPDIGGVVRARALAKQLEVDLAIIDKRRPRANVSEVMNIIGDVNEALKERGAKAVYAYCTHPVLSGEAIERITHSQLNELVVTDTIPLSAKARECSKIRQLSCAALLGETILRISNAESVSSLFTD